MKYYSVSKPKRRRYRAGRWTLCAHHISESISLYAFDRRIETENYWGFQVCLRRLISGDCKIPGIVDSEKVEIWHYSNLCQQIPTELTFVLTLHHPKSWTLALIPTMTEFRYSFLFRPYRAPICICQTVCPLSMFLPQFFPARSLENTASTANWEKQCTGLEWPMASTVPYLTAVTVPRTAQMERSSGSWNAFAWCASQLY